MFSKSLDIRSSLGCFFHQVFQSADLIVWSMSLFCHIFPFFVAQDGVIWSRSRGSGKRDGDEFLLDVRGVLLPFCFCLGPYPWNIVFCFPTARKLSCGRGIHHHFFGECFLLDLYPSIFNKSKYPKLIAKTIFQWRWSYPFWGKRPFFWGKNLLLVFWEGI